MRKPKIVLFFLIFVLVFALLPVEPAPAAVDASGLRQMFDKFDNHGRWDNYKSQVDNGQIAWDQSYILRAYLLMYQTTKDKQYLDLYVGHADSFLARRDNVRGVKDYRGVSLPAWRNGKFENYNKYIIYAVQTGLTAAPLAQFAAIVKNDSALSAYNTKANQYLQAAKDAIAVHDMRDKPQYLDVESRWYEDGNSMHLARPINMNLAQGSVMVAIYEATGDKTYLDKATKIANYFKQYLNVNSSTNSYVWKYFPDDSRYSTVLEDANHSVYDNEFIYWAYRNGIFNSTDMKRFANTAKVVAKNNGTIANKVDGTGTSAAPGEYSHWLWFEPWESSIFDVSHKLLASKTSVTPKELTGVALLNYAYANRNGTAPQPEPNPEPNPTPAPEGNLIKNSGFGADATSWVNSGNSGSIKTEPSGNKYLSNSYNFDFYQELKLEPGTYKLNARTQKGTAAERARVVVRFYHQDGSNTVPYNIRHQHSGTGWESIPEATIEVPSTQVSTRIYLSVDGGNSGTHNFDDITLVNTAGVPDPAPTPGPDTTNPQVTITSPQNGSAISDVATLKAQAGDDTGVIGVTYTYALSAQGPWNLIAKGELNSGTESSGTWLLNWDVSDFNNGTYYVRAVARDAAGNIKTSEPVAVDINKPAPAPVPDTTNPQVTITSPQNGSAISDVATLKAQAGDDTGVIGVTYTYALSAQGPWNLIAKGELNGGTESSGTWLLNWDVSEFNNGTYYVRAVARDAAGNIKTSEPVAVNISKPAPEQDTIAPVVSITSPSNKNVIKNAAILNALASDNKGVSELSFDYSTDPMGNWTSIGKAVLSSGTELSGTWMLKWDLNGLGRNTYYIRAVAGDEAGNDTVSEAIAVKINK